MIVSLVLNSLHDNSDESVNPINVRTKQKRGMFKTLIFFAEKNMNVRVFLLVNNLFSNKLKKYQVTTSKLTIYKIYILYRAEMLNTKYTNKLLL